MKKFVIYFISISLLGIIVLSLYIHFYVEGRRDNFFSKVKVFVFDTNNTFYYITDYPISISKKHLIENDQYFWHIYNIVRIGGSKFAINSLGLKTTLVYTDKSDKLIQDLDKVLENH